MYMHISLSIYTQLYMYIVIDNGMTHGGGRQAVLPLTMLMSVAAGHRYSPVSISVPNISHLIIHLHIIYI